MFHSDTELGCVCPASGSLFSSAPSLATRTLLVLPSLSRASLSHYP